MKTTYTTAMRFLLPVLILLVLAPTVYIEQHVSQQLDTIQVSAGEQARALGRLLNIAGKLLDEQTNISMRLLKEHCSALGAPTVNGTINVNGQSVPSLFLGQTQLTNNYKLVDAIKTLAGGTATLFVKSGNDFIRVTTNVQLLNGKRAVGTLLNPSGKAILAIRAGQQFQGVVDILGEPYITRYDPLFDKNGNVVGAYYVGYKVDMKVLREAVENTRYLKTGFALLMDSTNKTRFLSSHIPSSQVEHLMQDQPDSWVFVRHIVPDWGFTIIIAYPLSEARAMSFASTWVVVIVGSLLGFLLVAVILWQLRRLIFNPIGADPMRAIAVVNSIAAGNFEDDGFKAKAGTLMANVINMRQKLFESMTKLLENSDRMSLSASVFSHANDGIFITDAEMRIVEVNQSFISITGHTYKTALGLTPKALGFVCNDADFFNKLKNDPNLAEGWRGEAWNSRISGENYAVWIDIFTVRNSAHDICNYVGIFSDISEQKQAELNLSESESRLRYMLETSPIAVRVAKMSGREVIFYNQRYNELICADASHGVDPMAYYAHPEDYENILSQLENGQQVFDQLLELAIPNFGTKWAIASYLPIKYQGEAAVLGWFYDVTESKLAENNLRIAAIAFESQEGMIVTDANNIILRVNQAFTEITGYSAEDAIGQTPRLLNSGKNNKALYMSMWTSINNTGAWAGEIINRRKNGEVYPEYLDITAVKGTDGIVTNYVATLTDISDRKQAADEIEHLAFYDALTHLPNRRLMLDRLKRAFAVSARSGSDGALLFLDLDHFKTLNDSLGHAVGDMLLQQVASRLTECLRESDTVGRIARLGGDEFVVMLEDLSSHPMEAAAQAGIVGDKILTTLNQPYQLATHEYHSTVSIGVALFSDHEHSQEDLLKHADIAMYQAKKSGRNVMRFFDPHMQDAINTRADLERELRKAIEKQQFQLHYQIQVDHMGHPLGAEALIRWLHPERGMISPFHFIPLAEETGLILPIGQWVLETACAQLKSWEEHVLTRDLTLSINVSAKQFNQTDFVAQVETAIARYVIDPMKLKMELTESMLLDNVDSIIITMNALKKMGIRFSLDDFGTGYSSLQYLKLLPLYQLKIDQSFVRDIVIDSSDQAIVRTIIAMAHTLNLSVIAEGVETAEQQDLLLNNGCKHYQGYLFSKPVPIEAFEALLKKV